MNEKYKIIEDSELKIDKELKEVQKTIIYYGEKIREEIDMLKTLIDINKQYKTVKETEKGKDIYDEMIKVNHIASSIIDDS